MVAGVKPIGGDLLVETLEDGAQNHRRLRKVEDSPMIISNVAVHRHPQQEAGEICGLGKRG